MSIGHKISHEQIVHTKLNDSQMRDNLSVAMHTLQRNRLKIIDEKFEDWQGLRARAQQAKNNALMSLEERLLEFEKNATKMESRCIGLRVVMMLVRLFMN